MDKQNKKNKRDLKINKDIVYKKPDQSQFSEIGFNIIDKKLKNN